eukprot:5256960-Ditylum_brightwellii.AAC.1
MGDLFSDLEHVRVYIGNLLLITKGSWEEHLTKSDEVLTRLSKAGLKLGRRPTVKKEGKRNIENC